MGLEDSIKSYSQNTFLIRWAFALKAAEVIGRQISDTLLSPTLLSLRGQFRGLFDIDVPPIGQLWVSRGLADTWNALSNETASSCNVVIAQRLRWSQPAIRDLPAALARTSTSHFSLNLGIDTVNSRQKVVNAGVLLSTLICGRSDCNATEQTAARYLPIRFNWNMAA